MSRKKNARPRLFVATSYDGRAGVGVIVVGLRGASPRWWERVVRGEGSLRAAATELAIAAAREAGLRSVVICSPDRLPQPAPETAEELGGARVRWVHRRKNLLERKKAVRRLRELVPLPARDEEQYSWADWGVDLEIERLSGLEDEAPAGDETCPF